MAENTDLYSEIDNILNNEKNNVAVPDEKKEALLKRLQELADQGNDFDPDRLEGIIALASGNTSDIAKSVLQRATEQKNKLAQDNEGAEVDTPTGSTKSLYDNEVDTISQPSYNVRKEYERLSTKEDLTEEDKSAKQKIEKDVEAYLSNIGEVNTDNVVAIMDYLAVSEMSGLDEVKERNEDLSQKANIVIAEYDKENGLESLDGRDSQFVMDNMEQWRNIASQMSKEELSPSSPYSDILNSLSDEEKGKMQEFMMMNTLHSLKAHSPSEFGENATKQLSESFGNTSSEYALLINEEYLKQEAMADFCEQNKIKPEKLNEILTKAGKGEKLSDKEQKIHDNYMVQLKTHLEKAPSFTGPYKNQEFLRSAIVVANGVTISRLRDLDCRIAQKVSAPSASQEVTKENNSFAKNHPKLAIAVNMAKGIGISMAIGAAFGPVGLTAYSAYKTAGAIRKSYKRFKEQATKDGKQGNVKGFIKHLFSREGRVEALTLAGSVAATCISGYFTVLPGVENLQNLDLGMVGNITGNTGVVADAAAQTATQSVASVTETTAPSIMGSIKAGFSSIIASPRRAISTVSSLGVGLTKSLAAANNLRYARKQLAEVLEQAGIETDKKTLRSLEGLSEKEFYAKLKEIAPNLSEQQTQEAFKHVSLANKSNPKTEFLSATIGAGIGLGISAAADYIHDVQADSNITENTDINNISDTQSPVIEGENIAPHTGDVIWQNEDMADQRFESFGIDAKGANEMLREMGIIKEGDNHFYRQSELNNLVNSSDLTGEQKLTIQEWANDRDARVDAMLKWQAEHPAPQPQAPEIKEDIAPIMPDLGPIPTIDDTLPEELKGTLYSVQGKVDGQNFQMNVLADNPVEAGLMASEMADENGFLDKKSSISVRGDGVVTEIEQKAKDDYVTTKITTRDLEGDKLSTQTIKTHDNGVMESKFKGDLDGDGKNDTVTRVTGADGTSVSHTKFGDGERAVSYTDAEGRTTEVTSQEMEENGQKRVNSQLKKAYKEIAEDIKANNTNEQVEAAAVIPAVENTTSTVDNAVSTVENVAPTVENTTPVVENVTQVSEDSEQAKADFNEFSEQAKADFNEFSEQAKADFNEFSEQAKADFNEFSEQAKADFNAFSEQAKADFNAFSEQAKAELNEPREQFNEFREQAKAEFSEFSRTIEGKNITYEIGENGECEIDGTYSSSDYYAGNLVPSTAYRMENGMVKVGLSVGFDEGDAKLAEKLEIEKLMIKQDIYNSLEEKLKNGVEISDNEQRFMDVQEKALQERGLYMKEGGGLTRIAPNDLSNSQEQSISQPVQENAKETVAENTALAAENTTPAVENTEQAEVQVEAATVERTIEGTDISYKFENGSVEVSGTLYGVNTQAMLPRMTTFQDENGTTHYKCGGSTSLSSRIASTKESMALQKLVLHQEVYSDLQERMGNGENLGGAEQKFMSDHETALKERNLVVDENGRLNRMPSTNEQDIVKFANGNRGRD